MRYFLNDNLININSEITISDTVYPRGTLLMRKDEWETLGISEKEDLPRDTSFADTDIDRAHNIRIKNEINEIEQSNLMPRALRGYLLSVMDVNTPEYKKVKAVDDSIEALKSTLKPIA